MFYVYVIVSDVNGLRFYVGFTQDVNRRILEHNCGKTTSTKAYRPWSLFFFETVKTRNEARLREKYFKSGTGKEKIKRRWLGEQEAKNLFS